MKKKEKATCDGRRRRPRVTRYDDETMVLKLEKKEATTDLEEVAATNLE